MLTQYQAVAGGTVVVTFAATAIAPCMDYSHCQSGNWAHSFHSTDVTSPIPSVTGYYIVSSRSIMMFVPFLLLFVWELRAFTENRYINAH